MARPDDRYDPPLWDSTRTCAALTAGSRPVECTSGETGRLERIAIFAALQWECQPVLSLLRQARRERITGTTAWAGSIPPREVWVVRTGIGPDRARSAAEAMTAMGPFDLCVSTGCAGSLSPALGCGALTLATAVIGAQGDERLDADREVVERFRGIAERAGLAAAAGTVLCCPTVLGTAAEKRAAAARTGALAVEMEGLPIAAWAARTGSRFASVRAVLDEAETDLRDAGAFVDPGRGTVRRLALAAHLARHPGSVRPLREMQRMVRTAQATLARFFAAWLVAPQAE